MCISAPLPDGLVSPKLGDTMPERPDFAAIAAHQRLLRQMGGGLTVDYLEQVVRYAQRLERALSEVRDGRCDDPRARAAEALRNGQVAARRPTRAPHGRA